MAGVELIRFDLVSYRRWRPRVVETVGMPYSAVIPLSLPLYLSAQRREARESDKLTGSSNHQRSDIGDIGDT